MKSERSRALLPTVAVALFLLCSLLPSGPTVAQARWEHDARSPRSAHSELKRLVMGSSTGDPTGDTFGSSGEQIDITGLSAESQSGNLVLTVTFAGEISPPDAFVANSVTGFFDLDTDQSGVTGDMPWADSLSGSDDSGMGNEFYVDLFSFDSTTGMADVVDDATEARVGGAVLAFGPNQLTATIDLDLLGDEGLVNVAAVFGNLDEATDKVPNSGSVASGLTPDPPTESGCTTIGGSDVSACSPGATTACLTGDRFEVTSDWTNLAGDQAGTSKIHQTTTDTVIFYFLDDQNLEIMLKVLDGCAINDFFWVFGGGLTDLGVSIRIRDTATGEVMVCSNEVGTEFAPIRSTSAFAGCN